MYGLLLENLSEYVKLKFGEEKWNEICRLANVDYPAFSVHQVYSEKLIPKLSKQAIKVLGISEQQFFENMGVYFVEFVGQYGYDRVLSILGRHMRDFLNGLDNLHEYLKFSYPRMRAPSFICEHETGDGLTLHYRSKRRGFVYYTMGQIKQVAKHFYNMDIRIDLMHQEIQFDTVHVTFQLYFDNRAFTQSSGLTLIREEQQLPVRAVAIFEIFPFCIVFGSDMVIRNTGNSLSQIMPELVGQKILDTFDLVRPLIEFHFNSILDRTNNIFELVTVEPVMKKGAPETLKIEARDDDNDMDYDRNLHLKGQMMYMDEWKMLVYLGTPVMSDLESMLLTGMYINDLSMHDFSRDLMLAGTQQSVELKLALDQEQQKTKKLEESMKKLDEEMKRTDELLYQMIPKQVADRLRKGEKSIDTCEGFDNVTILFSDVVTFTEICSRITPMQVVSMLNAMYSIFDTLTERHGVYKVETIGDAYMVVSGAPVKEDNHAEKICSMALDMIEAITDLKDPSTGSHLRIRVGIHTGTVVAGVVGLKMPRYCLFGDSVNTASRLESSSEAMKIHISEFTKNLLSPQYKISERGEVNIKGKGTMKTYWLHDRENRSPFKKIDLEDNSQQKSPRLENMLTSPEQRRNVYSPVTFEDVARRSLTSSPIREGKQQEEEPPEEEDDDEENLQPPTPPTRKSRRRSSQLRKSQQLLAIPSVDVPVTITFTQEDIDDPFAEEEKALLLDPVPQQPPPPQQQPPEIINLPNSIPSPQNLQNGLPSVVQNVVQNGPMTLRQNGAVSENKPDLDNVVMDAEVIKVPVLMTTLSSDNRVTILNPSPRVGSVCPSCRQVIQDKSQRQDLRRFSPLDCCGGFGNATREKIQSGTCVLL